MSVCMSAVSVGISEVLIKYTGKYVNIYFIMKITFLGVQGSPCLFPSAVSIEWILRLGENSISFNKHSQNDLYSTYSRNAQIHNYHPKPKINANDLLTLPLTTEPLTIGSAVNDTPPPQLTAPYPSAPFTFNNSSVFSCVPSCKVVCFGDIFCCPLLCFRWITIFRLFPRIPTDLPLFAVYG